MQSKTSSLTSQDLLLWIEFTRNDEVFKSKIFADPWFDSEKIEFSNIKIDALFAIQHNQLSSRVERWTFEESGWPINLIIQHKLVMSEIAPFEGSSCFWLPKELKNPREGLINIQNEDNECFRWCLVRT